MANFWHVGHVASMPFKKGETLPSCTPVYVDPTAGLAASFDTGVTTLFGGVSMKQIDTVYDSADGRLVPVMTTGTISVAVDSVTDFTEFGSQVAYDASTGVYALAGPGDIPIGKIEGFVASSAECQIRIEAFEDAIPVPGP